MAILTISREYGSGGHEIGQRVAEKLGFLVEMSGEKTDQFEFFILSCPLGYYRAEQQGLCDAAMDLDRTMTRLCGAELAVKESIPGGASKCWICIRKI